MRPLILIAGAALALSACGNNDQIDNSLNINENLLAEDISSNDITAIDAVTGEDANMAADVNYLDAADANAVTNNGASPRTPRPRTPPPRPTPSNTAQETTANAAANQL